MITKAKIPKLIHYCWFGEEEKPELVKNCIKSWKKHLPDYQLMEWNENNFNIYCNRYVQEAYETKNYAYVNDYIKVHMLFHQGGIYLDTDVEVFKSFNDLLHHESFWGFEQENLIATSTIGAAKGNKLIKLFLDHYRHKKFIKDDGTYNELTSTATLTAIMEQLGVKRNGNYQKVPGVGTIYPKVYFSPYNYINYKSKITEATYTMHHFNNSWLVPGKKLKASINNLIHKE